MLGKRNVILQIPLQISSLVVIDKMQKTYINTEILTSLHTILLLLLFRSMFAYHLYIGISK